MMKVRLVSFALVMVLAGCGRVADLEPKAGHSLPPKPALASATPDAEKLLELPTYAAPKRVDELNTRGRPREPDRFDLPPPDGSETTPSTTGPDTVGEPK